MTELFRVKSKLMCSNIIRAEYLTNPMTLSDIRNQFQKDTISSTNNKWEQIIDEGKQWDMKYVCELVNVENDL